MLLYRYRRRDAFCEMNTSIVEVSFLRSLLSLRFWSIHENVHSTARISHGAGSLPSGTYTQRLGGRTTSTVRPNAF